MKLSFKKFKLYDSIALALFTSAYLLIGIIFNESLQRIITKTRGLQNIAFFGALVIIAGIIIILAKKRKSWESR